MPEPSKQPITRGPARDPATGRTISPYPPGTREHVVEAAKAQIMAGLTMRQIADSHGVPAVTLKLWLLSLGDEYRQLRELWLDSRLANADDAIEIAADPLSLARARELWKSATWYAERRDPARYGAHSTLAVEAVGLADVLRRVGGRTIDSTATPAGDTEG